MSSRAERDRARIRCLSVAINSMKCEIARVVQAGESPSELDAYAQASLAMGESGDTLLGLSMYDLVELIGPIAAMEKLLSVGYSPEAVGRIISQGSMKIDGSMRRDIQLYLEGVTKDRPVETSDVEA